MDKEKIKTILENHLERLSKIAEDSQVITNDPVLLQVINEGMKTISVTLLLFDKLWVLAFAILSINLIF